jgi:hypothetical protein
VGGAQYPSYVDGTLVTWSSSNPGRATVDANGNVTGLAEGASTITAQFQTFSLQLPVQVSGAWIARTMSVAGQGVRRYAIYVPAGLGGVGHGLHCWHFMAAPALRWGWPRAAN